MESLLQDIRQGLRVLAKSPGFTAVAVLTLALGIGANTAIFSLLHQLLLRRLPVPHPEQLVVMRIVGPHPGRMWSDGDLTESIPYPVYAALRDNNPVFSGLLARLPVNLSVAFRGTTERAQGELVSGNYFDVLGVRAALGRVFSQEDDRIPGAHPVAVLSFGYWKGRLGGDPAVLNQSILVNNVPLTVVGVSQPGFTGVQVGQTPDIFVPLMMKAQMTPHWDGLSDWNDYWLAVIGRRKPDISLTQAEAALQPLLPPLVEQQFTHFPGSISEGSKTRFFQRSIKLDPGSRGRLTLQRDVQPPLLALSAMAGLVLLMACANVANLLLARGVARNREFAVRAAMGASRTRLIRQLSMESALIGALGGVFGLALAAWTASILVTTLAGETGIQGLNPELDWRVIGFAFVASLFATILFGLFPAVRLSHTDLLSTLKMQGSTSSAAAPQVRARKVLVAVQVAFTVLLLAGGALFARTLWNLRRLDVGLPIDHVITFAIEPQLNGYSTQKTSAFCDQLRERIAALPGVHGVASGEVPMLVGSNSSTQITVPGLESLPLSLQQANENWISPGYFSALGVPLIAGREFTPADGAPAPKVAIVSESMARRFYPNQNPIGRTFKFGANDVEATIVGVVRDINQDHVRSLVVPFIYIPYAQDEKLGFMTFYVRTAQDPALLVPLLRRAVQQLDSNLPVFQLSTLERVVNEDLIAERMIAALSACFALLAALLASLGIYGVLAFLVAQRTREIGIRMVLGAERNHVCGIVFAELGWMFALGTLAGLPAAYGLARLSESLLYGVRAADPWIYLAAAILVSLVALAASSIPLRRALRVAPVIALRYE